MAEDTWARCVETAPFGDPVEPEVYMIVQSSSGSSSGRYHMESGLAASSSSARAKPNWLATSFEVRTVMPLALHESVASRRARSSSAITRRAPLSAMP